jgi:hypothetical protein
MKKRISSHKNRAGVKASQLVVSTVTKVTSTPKEVFEHYAQKIAHPVPYDDNQLKQTGQSRPDSTAGSYQP